MASLTATAQPEQRWPLGRHLAIEAEVWAAFYSGYDQALADVADRIVDLPQWTRAAARTSEQQVADRVAEMEACAERAHAELAAHSARMRARDADLLARVLRPAFGQRPASTATTGYRRSA